MRSLRSCESMILAVRGYDNDRRRARLFLMNNVWRVSGWPRSRVGFAYLDVCLHSCGLEPLSEEEVNYVDTIRLNTRKILKPPFKLFKINKPEYDPHNDRSFLMANFSLIPGWPEINHMRIRAASLILYLNNMKGLNINEVSIITGYN